MKNEANGLTIRATFGNIPVIDNDLFEVRAGIDVDQATSLAACLAESIGHIADQAVEDGMSSEIAYLVAFTADVIRALSNSVHGAYPRKAAQS
ncbi:MULTISPECIES: hypothetical protein [Rhodanobacter]|uniref:hypothetical protein n=1 Tax=Rhodanobacter TaxID=75309 RepID=UPI0003FAF1F5|nr:MULTISPECIES: hypothetical protein [Rhodanobacter]KZC20044.1 hypothetical protein RHOFW104R3_27880 [Rhodanobacter denitrificans]UJJ49561.1 hypothetical protein LRK52_09920 [Rhodanobacter denitrificans]UJM92275.1 hypothetical protein LRK32_09835 [Rhodanobacter denitrificans]UJM95804.1 hypothetical protein LRK44_09840 [Rhodanobacter denitrificans]UJN21365.1 hypothetical protein LRK54_16800 [Rhodanobacter denitrificans]